MKNLKSIHGEVDKIASSLLIDLDSQDILESVGGTEYFKNFKSMIESKCLEVSNSIYIHIDNSWYFLCKSKRLQLIIKFEDTIGLNKALLEIKTLKFLEAYSSK